VLLLSVNYFGIVTASLGMRRWHLLAACMFAAAGLVLAGMTMGTWWALAGMSIAAMGFYGSKGPFFAMPPMFLSGTGLAAGIAWINSLRVFPAHPEPHGAGGNGGRPCARRITRIISFAVAPTIARHPCPAAFCRGFPGSLCRVAWRRTKR
jgi:hypothetical protein